MIHLRDYRPEDERAWLECRVISYLDSAYFDDVQTEKSKFDNPLVDLVAEDNRTIVGFIEVECETAPGTVCSERPGRGAMIWNIVVRPEYRRQGLATNLLQEAQRRTAAQGIARFEAYTRDDPGVLTWYHRNGFTLIMSYLHVYLDHDEAQPRLHSNIPGLKPVKVLAHYTGADNETIRRTFRRVHDCSLFEWRF